MKKLKKIDILFNRFYFFNNLPCLSLTFSCSKKGRYVKPKENIFLFLNVFIV